MIGADAHGQSRGKFIPRWRFEKDPTEALHIADVMAIMDIEDEMMPRPEGHAGWWPSWESGFTDLEAVADLSTFSPASWIDAGAVVLCDYFHHDGAPVTHMPRSLLRSVTERASALGLTAKMATEYEFFVFRESMQSARAKGFRNLEPMTDTVKMYGGERALLRAHAHRRHRGCLREPGRRDRGRRARGWTLTVRAKPDSTGGAAGGR